jgi:xylulose-5-phosphate/fructose-6-phosphate phosphoketolase
VGLRGALQVAGAHAKDRLRNMPIDYMNDPYEHGIDKPEIDQWTWPG